MMQESRPCPHCGRSSPFADDVSVSADRLTDDDAKLLIRCYDGLAADEEVAAGWRAWYGGLAVALRGVLVRRHNVLVDVLAQARIPSTWEHAVESLPPEPPE